MGAAITGSAPGLEVVDLYNRDFFDWTQATAEKIRRHAFVEIDLAALAEEIEDLGTSQRTEVASRIRVIVIHLLKLSHQPSKKSVSGTNSIARERMVLEDIFEFSPSLIEKGRLSLARTYQRAVREATRQTKLPKETFPQECPYTYEQILNPDFYPGELSA